MALDDAAANPAAESAKHRRRIAVRALIAELIAAFPDCFKPHATAGLPPIKLEIDADILARRPDFDPALLQAAIDVYSSGPEYWRALIAGRPRVDLDGRVVQAVISPEEKAEAERRLAAFDLRQQARNKTFQEIAAFLDQLALHFPACFKGKRAGDPHPLKIGIHADILARMPDLDPVLLHAALRLYVLSRPYQRSVIAGRPRVDLDGRVVQPVTPDETAHARTILLALEAKIAARRANATKPLDAPPPPKSRAPVEDRHDPGRRDAEAQVTSGGAEAPAHPAPSGRDPRRAPHPAPKNASRRPDSTRAPRSAAPAPVPDAPAAAPPAPGQGRYPLSKRQQSLMTMFAGKPAPGPRPSARAPDASPPTTRSAKRR